MHFETTSSFRNLKHERVRAAAGRIGLRECQVTLHKCWLVIFPLARTWPKGKVGSELTQPRFFLHKNEVKLEV
jgi:hypothetical protein